MNELDTNKLAGGGVVESDELYEELDDGVDGRVYLPGHGKTLNGPLLEKRREAFLKVYALCGAAIMPRLQECPGIARGECPAVKSVMQGGEFTGCRGAEVRYEYLSDIEKHDNPPIPWDF